jgi:hemolysin activation/secretion protein
MKKLILTSFTIFAGFAFMNAQEIADNAIGLRLGDSDGFGAEISYQRALGDNNRLEADLGWRSGNGYDGFKLTGLYQWVWELDGNFNWYAGAGGGFGSYSFDNNTLDDETFFFLAGDIGIEYNFDIPLLISLDFRPELGFGDFRDDLDFDIALGIRYQF